MAADIHQLQSLGRLRGEFDRRSQDQESRIIALERENANLNFMNKQSIAQLKKLERDYVSQEKILRSIRKCAACRCLENRRKTSQPAEGGHAWDALLTQVATSTDGVTNAPQNSNTTGSTGSRATSSTRAHPNPSDRSRREELSDEVLLLRNVNARLQSTIDQLQTDISRKTAQIDSLRRSTSTNVNHGQSLAAKEREIEDLRKQVSELLQKNLEMATAASTQRSNQYYASADRALNEVQTTVRQFEQELVALRAERRELVESVAALRQDVTTKETSLRRCERLLTEANREKERLVAETRRLKRGDGRTRPTSQVTAPVNRSRSELDVNNAATGSRPNSRSSRSPFGGRRSANIYCPVCREMREELQALAPTTRAQSLSRSPVRTRVQHATSSPDSGFADRADKESQAQLRRLKEQLNKEQMNNRLLEHERNGLKHLHEEATAEASRLRRELLNRNSRPSTSTDPLPDATDVSEGRWTSKLRADNDKLRRQLQNTKERLESENARRQANESLLAAQKTKVEQDYREALSRLDQAEAQVAALSRQLADREVSIEQLNAQLIHQLSRRPTDSPAVHGMQLREYDNLIADLTGKVRHAEAARTAADSKCAELRRQLEDARAESSRLQVDVQSLRRELQHVSDSSGDLAEASTAQLKLQLRDKNMEISALRSKVHDLDQEYQKFESGLAEQQATLNRLQHNLSVTSSQKTDSEKRCTWLQEENSRLAGRINQLESDNSALRTELEAALVQQDYLNASAEKYISEIQSYQKLLSDKEAERAALRAKLQDASGQIRRTNSVGAERSSDGLATMEANLHDLQLQSVRDELESARAEQTKLVNERRTLEARVNRCERELDAVRCELEAERGQKGSLHADLAAARQQLIAADNHVLELTAKLSHVETELQKARAQIDNLSADVELEKAKAMSAAAAVSEVEKALVANREQHAHVTLDAQQRTTEVQMLRERIYDYEAKLELQGRDLIDTRSKLGQAQKDVESLRRDLSEERFERQRLQSRLNSNSQSSS